MAALAPMPRASETIATAANIGARRRTRRPYRASLTTESTSLRQRVLAVLQALRDLDQRIAVVLELDVRRDVPLVFLQELQHVLDRRIALPPRSVATAVGRLLLVLEVQVRDAGVVLLDERDR